MSIEKYQFIKLLKTINVVSTIEKIFKEEYWELL